jgi:hypothetical protein
MFFSRVFHVNPLSRISPRYLTSLITAICPKRVGSFMPLRSLFRLMLKYTLQLLCEPSFDIYWSNTNPTLILIKFTDNFIVSSELTTKICASHTHLIKVYIILVPKSEATNFKIHYIYPPHVRDCLTAEKLRNLDFLASWCTAMVHHNLSK